MLMVEFPIIIIINIDVFITIIIGVVMILE